MVGVRSIEVDDTLGAFIRVTNVDLGVWFDRF